MKFALNALPETLINMLQVCSSEAMPFSPPIPLQSFVSLRRIEKYLQSAEVALVPPLGENPPPVAFHGATVTWPQDRARSGTASTSAMSSVSTTPRTKFMLTDLNIDFPKGELTLVCGKLGSGKTLLLLGTYYFCHLCINSTYRRIALLGEADFLTGQVLCPKTPPDAIASFAGVVPPSDEWVIDGVCAYVPQVNSSPFSPAIMFTSVFFRAHGCATLRSKVRALYLPPLVNAEDLCCIENILFNLPYVEERYRRTLEVCALVNDLKILEDGDESEIGERGVCANSLTSLTVKMAY